MKFAHSLKDLLDSAHSKIQSIGLLVYDLQHFEDDLVDLRSLDVEFLMKPVINTARRFEDVESSASSPS